MAKKKARRNASPNYPADKTALALTTDVMLKIISIFTPAQDAASIVADVLVHFGAGYGAEQLRASGASSAAFSPIFARPTDLRAFHNSLLESTTRNFASLNWSTNAPLRDQIRTAAFDHGVLARKQVVADGTTTLKIDQILTTLRAIQTTHCSITGGGAGGGVVCDF